MSRSHHCPRCKERTVARQGKVCFWCLAEDEANRAEGWDPGGTCRCRVCVKHRMVYDVPHKTCSCKVCREHRVMPSRDQSLTVIAPNAKRTAL